MACLALAYAGSAATDDTILALALCFAAAGIAIGCVETAEHAAVAALTPTDLLGSAFGLLAGVQSLGNVVASATAGALWTLGSPAAGLLFAAALMVAAVLALAAGSLRTDGRTRG